MRNKSNLITKIWKDFQIWKGNFRIWKVNNYSYDCVRRKYIYRIINKLVMILFIYKYLAFIFFAVSEIIHSFIGNSII